MRFHTRSAKDSATGNGIAVLKASSITTVDDDMSTMGVGVWLGSDVGVNVAAVAGVDVTVLGTPVDEPETVCNAGVANDATTRVEAGLATGAVVAVGSLLVATMMDVGVTEFNESGVESDSAQPKNPASMSKDAAKVTVRYRKNMGMGKLFNQVSVIQSHTILH